MSLFGLSGASQNTLVTKEQIPPVRDPSSGLLMLAIEAANAAPLPLPQGLNKRSFSQHQGPQGKRIRLVAPDIEDRTIIKSLRKFNERLIHYNNELTSEELRLKCNRKLYNEIRSHVATADTNQLSRQDKLVCYHLHCIVKLSELVDPTEINGLLFRESVIRLQTYCCGLKHDMFGRAFNEEYKNPFPAKLNKLFPFSQYNG